MQILVGVVPDGKAQEFVVDITVTAEVAAAARLFESQDTPIAATHVISQSVPTDIAGFLGATGSNRPGDRLAKVEDVLLVSVVEIGQAVLGVEEGPAQTALVAVLGTA